MAFAALARCDDVKDQHGQYLVILRPTYHLKITRHRHNALLVRDETNRDDDEGYVSRVDDGFDFLAVFQQAVASSGIPAPQITRLPRPGFWAWMGCVVLVIWLAIMLWLVLMPFVR